MSRLANNTVCNNATIPQCTPGACSVVWRNSSNDNMCPPDLVEQCRALTQLSPTRGTFLPSPPIFYSTAGTPEERCVCTSPFRAELYLNTTAFRTFNIRRSEMVKERTLRSLSSMPFNINLDPNQVRKAPRPPLAFCWFSASCQI